MKKIIFIFIGVACSILARAQNITRITLYSNSSQDIITCQGDQGLLINFSKDGNIIDWGIEDQWMRLLKYMGRVDYYSANDDSAIKGKVRYIGAMQITYYASYENEAYRGKIKSIGSSNFDYYGSFEDVALQGKIKSVGGTQLSYFSSFDNDAYKGKFKSVGNTNLSYYASFDDKAIRGKVKVIDNVTFSYYTSFDRKEYAGAMKSGSAIHIINGIKYYVRN